MQVVSCYNCPAQNTTCHYYYYYYYYYCTTTLLLLLQYYYITTTTTTTTTIIQLDSTVPLNNFQQHIKYNDVKYDVVGVRSWNVSNPGEVLDDSTTARTEPSTTTAAHLHALLHWGLVSSWSTHDAFTITWPVSIIPVFARCMDLQATSASL